MTAEDTNAPKPAFITASNSRLTQPEDDAPGDAVEKSQKAAFIRARRKEKDQDQDQEQSQPRIATGENQNPSPVLAPPENTKADPKVSTSGKGRIYCGKDENGKRLYIHDHGSSVTIPATRTRPPHPLQLAKFADLCVEKGWTKAYIYKANKRDLDLETTRMLQSVIAQKHLGISCCTNQKEAGWMAGHLKEAKEVYRQTLVNRLKELQKKPEVQPA